MPTKKMKTSNGDVIEVNIVGNSIPDAKTVQDVYAGLSKDIRIKGIKTIEKADDLGTIEALANNVKRGFSFGASRHLEKNKEAQDQWNDKNPFKSFAADIVGGAGLFAIPGAGVSKLISVASKVPKLVKAVKAANAVKKLAKAHKIATAGVSGGIYSGVRSNIESRDWDPENVGRNTIISTMLGIPLAMAGSGVGRGVSKLLNRSGSKAAAFIDAVGGVKNFKKITKESKKLIHSTDPAITDLLKSPKLTPKDKAIIVSKYAKAQAGNPTYVDKALRSLEPNKSQNNIVKLMKKVADMRYGDVDFDMPHDVKASKTVMKVGPGSVKAKIEVLPDTENRYFSMAAKKASQRSPASDLGNKEYLSNKMSTKQLIAVRKELYDMQNQFLSKNRKLDAKEIGEKIKDINGYLQEKNPNLHKADRSFARMKNVEQGYEEGKAFKGYKPGESQHAPSASFVRGVWEQAKANRANLGGIDGLGDFDKIMPQHIQNVYSTTRPQTLGRIKRGIARRGAEQSNLKTMISSMPEYSKGLDLHGRDAAKFITRPKRALIGQMVKGTNAVSDAYEYNPKEMANLMYRNSKDVFKEITHKAKPTKKGKVLDTVLQSFAKTGGRGALNGRRINGL
jgi:hypothetical protein